VIGATMPDDTGTAAPIAVIDLDGTVADVRHRLHHLQRRPKDWSAFFAGIPDDQPLAEGLAVARTLAADHQLVYLTGRPERHRQATQEWLSRHDVPPGRLVMRRDGDRRPARIAKLAMLRSLSNSGEVAVLVDDDPDVGAAASAAGFRVLVADWATDTDQQTLWSAQEGDGRT
jgi:phosphoglycolate phosphatase-like HAD superfamily hydrolase